jgi:hypothetical protein
LNAVYFAKIRLTAPHCARQVEEPDENHAHALFHLRASGISPEYATNHGLLFGRGIRAVDFEQYAREPTNVC